MQKWFLAISLILNAKKGISTRQLARDLDLPVKTAWSVGMRIRKAFKSEERELLKGIFEMDETYAKSAVIVEEGKKIGYIFLPEFYADWERPNGPKCSQDVAREIIKLKEQLTLPSIYFKPPQEWLKKAHIFLMESQLKKEQYIVFGLGARREKKQASKEQIIETAIYAYKKHKLKTILVWTPGDKNNKNYPGDDEIAYDILKNAPKEMIPLRAPLDLTIGVIWLAKKSIFPDSGLMHFASASPGGVIGLFAETKVSPHPEQWGPLGLKSNYIEAKKSIKELGIKFLHKEINRL